MSLSFWLSSIVVVVFLLLTLSITIDGINKRNLLLEQCRNQNIFNELRQNVIAKVSRIVNIHNYNEKLNSISIIEKAWTENLELQRWERDKRSYQSLPNLLLAIGLLGTFLGITINLFLLGRNTAGKIELQQALSDIVGGMGIAFGSSLVALFFSIVLTRFYSIHILEIEKERIIIGLENFLDNEHIPQILRGKTLIDRVNSLINTIDNYSHNMHNLLTEFPQAIKDLHESATASSNLINTSANSFAAKVTQASDAMQRGANTLDNASQKLIGITTNFSEDLSNLLRSAESINNATQSMNETTLLLKNYGSQLETVNNSLIEKATAIDNLIITNHNDFINIANSLQQNGEILNANVRRFDQDIIKLFTDLQNLTREVSQNRQVNQDNFSNQSKALTENTSQIQVNNKQLIDLINQIILLERTISNQR